MNKKELLENVRAYSAEEIAQAVRTGLVTEYELKSETQGQFTPLLQRQVKRILEAKETAPTPNNEQSPAETITNTPVNTVPESVQTDVPTQPQTSKPTQTVPEQPQTSKPTQTAPTQVQNPPVQNAPLTSRLCPECGNVVPRRATECPNCGMPLNDNLGNINTNNGPVTVTSSTPIGSSSSGAPQPSTGVNAHLGTPPNLHKFSWGGFVFGWLWGVCNGVYWSLILLFLSLVFYIPVLLEESGGTYPELEIISFIASILMLVLRFVLGFTGNKSSWNSKKVPSIEAFVKAQQGWRTAALVVFGIGLGITLIIVIALLS